MSSNLMDVEYQEKTVFKALEELDDRLADMNVTPFELSVVGGFALLLEGIRMSDYTDIDYIGDEFNSKVKDIIEEVGMKYGLGRGWINNDVLLTDSCLEELENTTGSLKFSKKLELKVITVNTLDKKCLLRMKVIAVDTSYAGMSFGGGEFTRQKDFNDIKLLSENLGMSYNDIVRSNYDYVICPEIFFMIRWYMRFNDPLVFSDRDAIDEIIITKGLIDVR